MAKPGTDQYTQNHTTTGVKTPIEVKGTQRYSFAVAVNTDPLATIQADYEVEVRIIQGGSNWYPVDFVCGAGTKALDSLNGPVSAFRINVIALDPLEDLDFEVLAAGTLNVKN